jgi:subfamily B ATP-binding cassette protein MsbA
MILPRRGLIALSFVLMIINRFSGLVLPYSTKYMVDDVIGKHRTDLLVPIVLGIVAATLIQGLTSFSLTQLLSKTGQRLIAELRRKVQRHVGLLPVNYYDANKSGVLVARIMTDVEGVRNLIGTGLVEFVGGIMTACIALVVLVIKSPLMTGLTGIFVIAFSFVMKQAFTKIRPIFRERGKINAEVTGRLTESLGGVRVVKGYHAESREAQVFSGGVQRLLDNVLKSLTATSLMSLSATVLMGIVGAIVWYVGTRQILNGSLTLGDMMTFVAFLAFLIAPVIQVVSIGTQLTEALAGLDRTREVLSERPEDRDPNRTVSIPPIRGEVEFKNVGFAYDPGKPVLFDVSFKSDPGTVTRSSDRPAQASRPSSAWSPRSTPRTKGQSLSTASTSQPYASTAIARSSASSCKTLSYSTARSKKTSPSRGPARRKSRSSKRAESPALTNSPKNSKRNTTPSSASAASSFPADNASASRSPERSSPILAS